MTDAQDLLPTARQAVHIASEIVRARSPRVVTFKSDRDMVTEVDFSVEHAVRAFLSRETPEIGILGEEEGITGQAHNGLLWVLDPVDGTANYSHGIPLCGVSLGLVDRDRSVLGVIDLPFLHTLYTAVDGHGAQCNGEAIRVSRTDGLDTAIIAVGDYAVGANALEKNRVRLPLNAQLASRVQRVRMHGSAALDLAWVAHGRVDAAIILNNKAWDTAAGVAIAREAGAAVTDLDGVSHTTNAHATVAATPAIVADILDLIRQVTTNGPPTTNA